MASITAALGPLFLLILLGALLGLARFPGGDFWARMERLIYFLLFPAMLVATLARADISQVPVVRLAVVLLGTMLALSLLLWWCKPRLGLDAAAFTSVFQGAVRFNTYVGVAGAAALHGSQGATVAAVALALMIPTVNVLCVLTFIAAGTLGRSGLWRSLWALAQNPLILACLIGIGLNLSGIGLPGWSGRYAGTAGSSCASPWSGGCRRGTSSPGTASPGPGPVGLESGQAHPHASTGPRTWLGLRAGSGQPECGAVVCCAAHRHLCLYSRAPTRWRR